MRKIFGINSDCIDGQNELLTLELIKKAGFTRTFTSECNNEIIKAYKAKADELNITVEFLHAPFRGINAIWEEGDGYLNLYNGMIEAIDTASANNIPAVIIHTSSGWTPPEINQLGLQRYDDLLSYATQKGVILTFENLRSFKHVSCFVERYKENDNVRFCFDFGHNHCYTPNDDFISLFGNKTICTHIHDNHGYFADLVTGFNISGKAPYGIGEESRPNDLTYVITSNSATIGSDTASRSFIFYISPPKKRTGDWKDRVMRYIDEHRYEILGDIYNILTSVKVPNGFVAKTRVPEFEREVLWKIAGTQEIYEQVIEQVLTNRNDANVDEENAVLAVETIKEIICDALHTQNPDEHVCFLRTNLINKILGKTLHIDIQDVRNMVNTGRITCLRRDMRRYPASSASKYRSSGILYIGENVSVFQNIRVRILGLNKSDNAVEVTKECGGIEDLILTQEIRAARVAAEQMAANADAIDVNPIERTPPAFITAPAAAIPAPTAEPVPVQDGAYIEDLTEF